MTRLIITLLLAASSLQGDPTPETSHCPPMPPGTPPPKVPAGTTFSREADAVVKARLAADADASSRWSSLLSQEDPLARRAALHLVAFMPEADLRRLAPADVAEELRLAIVARREFA
jgi:hypothetical protein